MNPPRSEFASSVGSIKFVATDKNTIELNSQQEEAFETLEHSYKINLDGSTPFEKEDALLDEIEEYVDERLADLSKAIDSEDPLAKLDEYNNNYEKWTVDKKTASDKAWEEKQEEGLE